MAVNLQVLSNRLKQAREVLAYQLDEVSVNTGIEVIRLKAIESNNIKPSGDEILILASFYNCDFRAFLDDKQCAPVQQSDILFRRYGDAFTKEDRRAVQEFLYLCVVESELEKILSQKNEKFSFIPIGTFYKAHGQQAAEALRAQLGYRDVEVPRDVYKDFRTIGIHMFRRRLVNPDISGLYVYHPVAGHCVLVNYDEDIYRQRFSATHEAAHAIFDSGEDVLVTYLPKSAKYKKEDLKEIRANCFASRYLMPPTMLEKLSGIDETTAIHWAQEFRVSTSALANALKDAGLINESTARAIRAVRVPTDEKIDPEAPQGLTSAQRNRRLAFLESGLSHYYVNLCFEAHHRGAISTGRLAEVIRVDLLGLNEVAELFGRKFNHEPD
jgi:Zn-dependent peptidase ImmA (M78 family)